jgi:uncharacterized UPF0146 family protein
LVIGLAVGLLVLKAAILSGLGLLSGMRPAQSINLGILLSQGGEFAFVLLGAALGAGVVAPDIAHLMVVVVALTMMATPFLATLGRRVERQVERHTVAELEARADEAEELTNHVVIAGYGRVGAAVAAQLKAAGADFIAVDLDPHRINEARAAGLPVYFGDATRPEILEAVHVERARALVVAVDNPQVALRTVSWCATSSRS